MMPGKIIKDYFSFTRKERIAVLILAFLIVVVFLLPYWLAGPEQEDKAELDRIRLQLSRQQQGDQAQQIALTNGGQKAIGETRKVHEDRPPQKMELFYFDPNVLSNEGWKRLGLQETTIKTINNYLSKGGRFKTREDIGRIYGLHASEAQRLIPYVKITGLKSDKTNGPAGTNFSNTRTFSGYHFIKKPGSVLRVIDINTADTTELIALPGIGSKLATRILHFREKLGGFYSVYQLSEIYGLPDSTFQNIRPLLTIANRPAASISINTATADDLKQHPYIKWNLANAIVAYRLLHGPFKSLDDLQKIDLVTSDVFSKLAPYVKLE
jgi:competence ComEA-like helix-hairpin-helix protein